MVVIRNKRHPLPTAKRVSRRRNSEEASHQKAFFKWLSFFSKELRKVTFHIPNGGKRDVREARNLKACGVTAGVPDIFCAVPMEPYCGLFIEMKSRKGKQTVAQSEMLDTLKVYGYQVCVCRSWFEARDALLSYIRMKRC